MKVRKRLIATLLTATMLAAGFCTSALADDNVVKIAFTDAPTLAIGDMEIYHPSYAAMLAFKGAFEKSTGGEYTVELYPNGTLGDAASTLEQMLIGTLQGSTPADGTFSAFAPDIQAFTIPYLFSEVTVAYDVLDGEFGQELFENIAYTMAKHADSSVPDSPEEWLDAFSTFSIYQVLPEIIKLWGLNLETQVKEKNHLAQLTGK